MRTRDIIRKRTAEKRDAAKAIKISRTIQRKQMLLITLAKIKNLFSQSEFIDILKNNGIASAPKILLKATSSQIDPGVALNDNYVANAVLDFAIAWKFIFPLFSNDAVADCIEKAFPGLVSEVKDMFIALVMNGPLVEDRKATFTPTRLT